MKLKLILDSIESLPTDIQALYTEKDGKFHLTGVEGMKTQTDIDYVKTILEKEREAHKDTKKKLEDFHGLNMPVEEVLAKLDRFDELEAAAGDKIDETKLNEMVETRLKTKTAPLERDLDKLRKENLELNGKVGEFETKDRTRGIHDAVRKAATSGKVIGTAVDDILMLAERVFDIDETGAVVTKDNVGVTPGVDPAVWLTDMQEKRPHWWAPSQGGGAGGSGGGSGFANNPFSADHWNMTEQGKLVRENADRASQMAKAAGTVVGGAKPVKK